jgi:CubicO group peptidase (beta-lactamase class C family)
VRFILKHQDDAPGTKFHYSDYGAHLLSPILVQATGKSVLAYARAKLFDPLGVVTRPGSEPLFDEAHRPEYQRAGFAWPVDPQGFHTTAFFLKLRPRDMATFGQVFLQNGQWNGQQVVPAAWVRQATTAQTGKAFPDFGASAPGSAFNDKLRLLLVGGTHYRCHRLLRAWVRWAAGRGRAVTTSGHRRVLPRRRDAPQHTSRRRRRIAAPGRRDRANHQDP